MKRLLLGLAAAVIATGAVAADLPRAPIYKAEPLPAAHYSWAGIYIGGIAGYGWGQKDANINGTDDIGSLAVATGLVPNTLKTRASGGTVGGTVGIGWQQGYIYYGLEADMSWARLDGSDSQLLTLSPLGVPVSLTTTASQQLNWYGTFRGRLGYVFWDRALIYGTVGLVFGEVEDSFAVVLSAPTPFGATAAASSSRTAVGWTAGAGIEAALGSGWSAKVEYLYADLGNTDLTATAQVLRNSASFAHSQDDTFHFVRAGLNYRLPYGQ